METSFPLSHPNPTPTPTPTPTPNPNPNPNPHQVETTFPLYSIPLVSGAFFNKKVGLGLGLGLGLGFELGLLVC